MIRDDVQLLYDYNAWANNRVLEACGKLSPEQFTRELGSRFSSVRETLAHIMEVEWLWLERWNRRMPTQLVAIKEFPDLSSIRQCWAEIVINVLSFAAQITIAD